MPKLIVPVGIPGCGKSTLAQRVLNHNNLRIVSTDDIRAALVQKGELSAVNDMSKNDEVFAQYHKRIEDLLLDHYDVYADATNLQSFAREPLRVIADRVGAEIHLILFTNLSVAVSRNSKRPEDRIVPPKAVVGMLEQYEKALVDIPQEQYATVTTVEGVS